MPSQEEYLDSLLKDVMNGGQVGENSRPDLIPAGFFDDMPEIDEEIPGVSQAMEYKESYDIQDTANMSPEDIERILAESEESGAQNDRAQQGPVNLETLLQEAEEANLKDIHDMLHKADRNEPVDEGIIALLEQAQEKNVEIDWKDIEEEERLAQSREGGFGKKLLDKWKSKREAGKKKKAEKKAAEKKAVKSKESRRQEEEQETENQADQQTPSKLPKGGVKETVEPPKEARMSSAEPGEDAGSSSGEVRGQDEIDALFGQIDAEVASFGGMSTEEELASIRDITAEIEADQKRADPLDGLQKLSDEEILAQIQGEGDGAAQDALGLGLPNDLFEEFDALTAGNDLEGLESVSADDLSEKDKESQTDAEGGKPAGRKGLFAKLVDLLTEEDEEEGQEQSELILSEENDAILRELDQEGDQKGKKGKKNKKKKGKEAVRDASEEQDDEKRGKGKEGKKEKKPKKAKEPRLREVEEPGKKLSKRRVLLIFLICITIGTILVLLGNVTVDFADKKKAADAYYKGDYETCYQNLVGKSLNQSQQVMFGKSESILRMRLWMREYERFVEEGEEPEALDSLMQSVHDYPTLQAFSGKWNAASEVQEIYDQMLAILKNKYGLTEEMAKTIAYERDDLLYSKMVRAIAGGGAYGDWEQEPQEEPESGAQPEIVEDLLPEEEELGNTVFAE